MKLNMTIVKKSESGLLTPEQVRAHNEAHAREELAKARSRKPVFTLKSQDDRRSPVSFSDVLLGGSAVRKSHPVGAGVREFMPNDNSMNRTGPDEVDSLEMESEDARMATTLASWSGKGTVHTPASWRPADAFKRGMVDSWLYDSPDGANEELGRRVTSFSNVNDSDHTPPQRQAPRNLNYRRDASLPDVVAAPENFRAPRPGVIRTGTGYVLKSQDGQKYTVQKSYGRRHVPGFWGNIIADPPSLAEVEYVARQVGDTEALAAIQKARKAHQPTDGFSKARCGGARFV